MVISSGYPPPFMGCFISKMDYKYSRSHPPASTINYQANMTNYITINRARLAYDVSGPDDGPLIITLHGGRGFGDHTSDFSAYSALSTYNRVLSFTYRGHGLSSATKPYTFQQIVDDIEGLRVHFTGTQKKVVIIGGSFGGFLALQYAVAYPDNVSHLVLRGTAASWHRCFSFKAFYIFDRKTDL